MPAMCPAEPAVVRVWGRWTRHHGPRSSMQGCCTSHAALGMQASDSTAADTESMRNTHLAAAAWHQPAPPHQTALGPLAALLALAPPLPPAPCGCPATATCCRRCRSRSRRPRAPATEPPHRSAAGSPGAPVAAPPCAALWRCCWALPHTWAALSGSHRSRCRLGCCCRPAALGVAGRCRLQGCDSAHWGEQQQHECSCTGSR